MILLSGLLLTLVYVYVARERTNIYDLFTLLFYGGLGHQHSKGANGSDY